jgi:transposase
MAGKSRVTASETDLFALRALAAGADRGEADRARAILLTLAGWTGARIAEAYGVREDTVRQWRSDFMRGRADALKASIATGPKPIKAAAALRVATPLLSAPVADRTNWTLARLSREIAEREGVSISRSQLSKVLRKKGVLRGAGRGTRRAEGAPPARRKAVRTGRRSNASGFG